jgi:hypothetical protein
MARELIFLMVTNECGTIFIYRVETLTGIKFITWKLAIFVKNTETAQFLFFLAHILTHIVFAYLLPEVRNHPNNTYVFQ